MFNDHDEQVKSALGTILIGALKPDLWFTPKLRSPQITQKRKIHKIKGDHDED